MALLAIYLNFIQLINGEVEVVVIQAKSEDCRRKAGISTCKMNAVNTVILLPNEQINSLSLKNNKGIIMGELELSMHGLQIQCNQKILRYLRSYEVKVQSIKRCPAAGTCKAGRCNHIRTKDYVEELSEWNDYPGNSFCIEGKSLWGYGCSLPGADCYFYRVYAIPKSDEIFKLVSCPTWDYSIEVDIGLVLNGNMTKKRFTLNPGMTFKWKDIKFTLLDVTPPMAPVLNSEFIIGESGIAISENSNSYLECYENAGNFSKCELEINACKECWLEQDIEKLRCACSDFIIEKLIKDPRKSLPLEINRIRLRRKENMIISESNYLPIMLMIRFEDWLISSNIDITSCKINPEYLKGCYSCMGAIFKFNCTTEYGLAYAEIKCPGDNVFTAKCSEKWIDQKIVLSFDRSEINEICNVYCSGGITNFTLKGQLEFILPEKAKVIVKEGSSKIFIENSENNWLTNPFASLQFLDWKNILFELISIQMIFMIILSFVLIIIALKLFLKYNPFFRGYKLAASALIITLLAGGTHSSCVERLETKRNLINYNYVNIMIEACVAIPEKNKVHEIDCPSFRGKTILNYKKEERFPVKKRKRNQIKQFQVIRTISQDFPSSLISTTASAPKTKTLQSSIQQVKELIDKTSMRHKNEKYYSHHNFGHTANKCPVTCNDNSSSSNSLQKTASSQTQALFNYHHTNLPICRINVQLSSSMQLLRIWRDERISVRGVSMTKLKIKRF